MTTLFISHSSKDKSLAAELDAVLNAEGYQTFLDSNPDHGIHPGADWEATLWKHLRQCRAVIVLCTRNWLASPWCMAEAMIARERGKLVFTLIDPSVPKDLQLAQNQGRVESIGIPDFLKARQFASLESGARSEAFDLLVTGLTKEGLNQDFPLPEQPYPGLEPFQEADAAVFFGRDDETSLVLEALNRSKLNNANNFILVLGASGSGKSSLIRAGVLPILRRLSGASYSADRWIIASPFRGLRGLDGLIGSLASLCKYNNLPKEIAEKLHEIEASVAEMSDVQRGIRLLRSVANNILRMHGANEGLIVIVLDQMEEVFATPPESTARAVLRLLLEATAEEGSSIVVLATMRSDFLNSFQLFPGAAGHYEGINLDPMPLSRFGLLIEGPASRFGLQLDPGLTEQLIEDTHYDDALPLLAFTLRQLYTRCHEHNRITLKAYKDLFPPVTVENEDGSLSEFRGVSAAIKHTAEKILVACGYGKHSLANPDIRDLPRAFFHLVQLSSDGQFTRRTALWCEIPKPFHPVLQHFVSQRLLISGESNDGPTLSVAHEAIFRVWDRLSRWLQADRTFLLWRQRLRASLSEWDRTGGDKGALLRGVRLVEARQHLAERKNDISNRESSFIQTSHKWQLREKLVSQVVIVIVFLALTGLSGYAFLQWRQAELQRALAQSRTETELYAQAQRQFAKRLAHQSLLATDKKKVREAFLLAAESLKRVPTPEGYMAWARGQSLVPALESKSTFEREIIDGTFSHDGEIFLARPAIREGNYTSPERSINLIDIDTGESIRQLPIPDAADRWSQYSISRSKQWVYLNSYESRYTLDLRNGQIEKQSSLDEYVGTLSPDEALTPKAKLQKNMRGDGWNVELCKREGEQCVTLMKSRDEILKLEFDLSGTTLVVIGENSAHILELSGNVSPKAIDATVGSDDLAFSPYEGEIAAISSDTSRVIVLDLYSGNILREFRHNDAIREIFVSPDGALLGLMTRSKDGVAQLTISEIKSGRTLKNLAMPFTSIAASFSPRSDELLLATEKAIWHWSLRPNPTRGTAIMTEGNQVLQFTSDSKNLFTVTDGVEAGSSIVKWDVSTGAAISNCNLPSPPSTTQLAMSADGNRAAYFTYSTLDRDEMVFCDDLSKCRCRRGIETSTSGYVTMSKDGRFFAAFNDDLTVVWRTDTGEEAAKFRHPDLVRALSFSPDGRRLAVAAGTSVRVWDVESERVVSEFKDPDSKLLAFDSTGSRIANAFGSMSEVERREVDIVVWESSTGEELKRIKQGDRGVKALTFSPDGSVLAALDYEVRLWDSITGELLARIELQEQSGSSLEDSTFMTAIAFSPDGRFLAVADSKKVQLMLWRTNDLIEDACMRVDSNFGHREWAEYMGNAPYRATCEELLPRYEYP